MKSEWNATDSPEDLFNIAYDSHVSISTEDRFVWVEGCRRLVAERSKRPLEQWVHPLQYREIMSETLSWIRLESRYVGGSERANLLREVVGNPWNPLTIHPRWVTSDVKSLARAAAEMRVEPRQCEECCGYGGSYFYPYTPHHVYGPMWNHCAECNGSGIELSSVGLLNQENLLVLSDALEDAGVPQGDERLRILREGEVHYPEHWLLRLINDG